MKNDIVIGGTYLHYKKKKYRVLGLVRHSETLEELVYYECLYDNPGGQFWVRPKELFLGQTEAGETRFQLIEG